MKKVVILALFAIITSVCIIVVIKNKEKCDFKNEQTSLTYDFSFAELAIKYLETGNSEYLQEISNLDATTHLYNHALHCRTIKPTSSKLELITNLLSPIDKQKELLPIFKKRLDFAKEEIAKSGIAEKTALQFLPADYNFSSSLFFTFGYNHAAYGESCNVNLADTTITMDFMIYLAAHELHHTGFFALKGGYIPSLDITTYKEMLHEIEYCTHLEGMAVYAQLSTMEEENPLNSDMPIPDLKELEEEYFDIYYHFKNALDSLLTQEDWNKFHRLSDGGLWYTMGAHMTKIIDKNLGREKLVSLISEPSENFVATYLELKRQ